MKKAKWRVIIDTNIWISFLITNSFRKLDTLIADNRIEILFSKELIEEFTEVISRPKFQIFFSPADTILLFNKFDKYGTIIKVKSRVAVCRDVKDNFLLALAKDGDANYLITGDKDLLSVTKFEKCIILPYAGFEKLFLK